jgi:hypothetical protein
MFSNVLFNFITKVRVSTDKEELSIDLNQISLIFRT